MKKINMKIILPTILGSLIIGAGVGAQFFPTVKVIDKVITVDKFVNVSIPVDRIVEKNITIEKTVLVDNKNLNKVLQGLYDDKGNVSYITKGLKDTEINQIADRIIFINEIKTLAINETLKNVKNFVTGQTVNNVTLRNYDISNIRVDDRLDYIGLIKVDFVYNDATVSVSGKFEQNHIKYNYTVELAFVGNKFDRIISSTVN